VKESGGPAVDQDSIKYVMNAIDSNKNEVGTVAINSGIRINELSNENYILQPFPISKDQ
jgi:hypothetical protein